jgi:ribose transport system substrate-binding protein
MTSKGQIGKKFSRRAALKMTAATGALTAATFSGCETREPTTTKAPAGSGRTTENFSDEEYVWISANANLPLFVAHDHHALFQIGRELGVKVTISGPNTVDIPGLVSAVEQTAARRPTGMMVVGWDPSALVPAIDKAVENGIPVVCVDADVPASKRLSFIGTDWYELGVRQAEAMLGALNGRKGKVAMLGLIEQYIDQRAFAGFRSVAEKAGLVVMEPQQDKGNQAEAARVASAILQSVPDLVGIAGFDSESGPGIGLAIKETGRAGKVIGTSVEAELQHLQYVREGILSAAIGQKRELFTYQGVKALFEVVHSSLKFTANDVKAGVVPIPSYYNTGTYTVTRANVDFFLRV